MPRAKKSRINASTESLTHLLQEIYNECVTQRSDALTQRNKLLTKIEELEDVQLAGKLTADLLKIVDLAIDKKLALAKLMTGMVGGGKSKDSGESDLTTEQKKFLHDTMKKIKENEDVDVELPKQNG